MIYGSSLRKIRSLEDYVSNLYPSPRSSRFLKMKRIKISCYKNQKRDFCNLVIILKKQINIGEFTFISQLQETNFFLFIRISHIISQPSQDSKDRNFFRFQWTLIVIPDNGLLSSFSLCWTKEQTSRCKRSAIMPWTTFVL